MSDLQNKSDWLAEHLLRWKKDYAAWFDGENPVVGVEGSKDAWQPHEKIEQCFAYIIPAMEKLGHCWNVVKEPDVDERVGAYFWINSKRNLYHVEDENPAAAIVEAAYSALQKEGVSDG